MIIYASYLYIRSSVPGPPDQVMVPQVQQVWVCCELLLLWGTTGVGMGDLPYYGGTVVAGHGTIYICTVYVSTGVSTWARPLPKKQHCVCSLRRRTEAETDGLSGRDIQEIKQFVSYYFFYKGQSYVLERWQVSGALEAMRALRASNDASMHSLRQCKELLTV